ncbi:serine threonine protein kinase [Colletotrichum sojae]|uniref:Serine threonine protein kinase n=1 Tax=Colletotrichum sojae TaxID=2175907 RepID=A0A8H6MUJ0_9PEZI|nr:serine threonine protein kinase [Colletotrichum sojae]
MAMQGAVEWHRQAAPNPCASHDNSSRIEAAFHMDLLDRGAPAPHDVEKHGSPKSIPPHSSSQNPAPRSVGQAGWTLEFPRRCYDESYQKGTERPGHSLQLVAIGHDRCRWHVRVVFEDGLLIVPGPEERKAALVDLCHAVDFSSLTLLGGTVTELYVSTRSDSATTRLVHDPLPDDHPFAVKSDALWVSTREDPARFRYPSYIGTGTRQIELSRVRPMDRVGVAVFKAQIESEGDQIHALKQIERPLYLANDSLALEKELQVLEQAGGRCGIVRLIAAVVSGNPCRTAVDYQQNVPPVLHGILVEYHPGGSLAEALLSAKVDAPWQRWGAQLCTAVDTLHQHNVTHMDIKPSNMVLDKDRILILIDVGGFGGVTWEWLSPTVKELLSPEFDPLTADFQLRKENGIWAVGKVLSKMAEAQGEREGQQQLLRSVAEEAMDDPAQASLSRMAANLSS